jgi:hypothetical protein
MRYVPITRSIYLAPALSRRCTRPRRRLPRVPPSAGSSASGGSASGVSQITSNWDTFFDSATPDSKRVQLLQNGSQFASSIKAYASGPLAAAVTSKGDSVTLSSTTQANFAQAKRRPGGAVQFLDGPAPDQQRWRVAARIQVSSPVAGSKSHSSAVTNRSSPKEPAMASSAPAAIAVSEPPARRVLRHEAMATLAVRPTDNSSPTGAYSDTRLCQDTLQEPTARPSAPAGVSAAARACLFGDPVPGLLRVVCHVGCLGLGFAGDRRRGISRRFLDRLGPLLR